MRPLAWTELTAFVLISALLATPALAQTATDPPNEASTAAPPPSATTYIPVAIDPPPAPPPPEGMLVTGLTWLERPGAVDFARNYPHEAQRQNITGRVTLDCIVLDDGRLDCTVLHEDPPGRGFAEATLRISRLFRIAPQTTDGTPTVGGRIRRTIRWMMN